MGCAMRTLTGSFAVGRDFADFIRHVRGLIDPEVHPSRLTELVDENESLRRTWMAWVEMPLEARQTVTLIAHIHYANDRVTRVDYSAGDPRPVSVHADDHVVTVTRPATRPRSSGPPPRGGVDVSAGATGAPEEDWGRWIARANTWVVTPGRTLATLLTIGGEGVAAAATSTATAATASSLAALGSVITAGLIMVGSPIFILAGLHTTGAAQLFRDQISYYRGYVLAMADMAAPRDPNQRSGEISFFNVGRNDAIHYINTHGQRGVLGLARLYHDHRTGQGRVDFLWADVVSSRYSSGRDRGLAQSLKPRY